MSRRGMLAEQQWLSLAEVLEVICFGLLYDKRRMPHVPGFELVMVAQEILAEGIFGWLR